MKNLSALLVALLLAIPASGGIDPLSGSANDHWVPTSLANAPRPRSYFFSVWTGSRMLIFGDDLPGASFDPVSNTWHPIASTGLPLQRDDGTVIWTGSKMIVWGGELGTPDVPELNSGAVYDPASNTWKPTSMVHAPSVRVAHTAVWTGTKMIVWGGSNDTGVLNTGGIYDPETDTWTPTSTVGAPNARDGHCAVWTGSRMIVWAGDSRSPTYVNSGGIYDPETDTWQPMSTVLAPSARYTPPVVWTGTAMIVWGSSDQFGNDLNSGGIYDPDADSWKPMSLTNAPLGRVNHTAVWTGSRLLVWGGALFKSVGGSIFYRSGALYDPVTDSWSATTMAGAPEARAGHTAVWTGSSMIVWGGGGAGDSLFSDGGIYFPPTEPCPANGGRVCASPVSGFVSAPVSRRTHIQ